MTRLPDSISGGWAGWLGWAGLAGWPAGYFIDFHGFPGFHEISWISGARGFAASADVCRRDVAPKETFIRFQLAAVSLIFMEPRIS